MTKNASASRRAANAIARQLSLLEITPGLGRSVNDHAEMRESLIEFGDSGYVVLYRHDETEDSIAVLAFRHQKEAGY